MFLSMFCVQYGIRFVRRLGRVFCSVASESAVHALGSAGRASRENVRGDRSSLRPRAIWGPSIPSPSRGVELERVDDRRG